MPAGHPDTRPPPRTPPRTACRVRGRSVPATPAHHDTHRAASRRVAADMQSMTARALDVRRATPNEYHLGVEVALAAQAATGFPIDRTPDELRAVLTARQSHAVGVWLAWRGSEVVGHGLVEPIEPGSKWARMSDEGIADACNAGTLVELGGPRRPSQSPPTRRSRRPRDDAAAMGDRPRPECLHLRVDQLRRVGTTGTTLRLPHRRSPHAPHRLLRLPPCPLSAAVGARSVRGVWDRNPLGCPITPP